MSEDNVAKVPHRSHMSFFSIPNSSPDVRDECR